MVSNDYVIRQVEKKMTSHVPSGLWKACTGRAKFRACTAGRTRRKSSSPGRDAPSHKGVSPCGTSSAGSCRNSRAAWLPGKWSEQGRGGKEWTRNGVRPKAEAVERESKAPPARPQATGTKRGCAQQGGTNGWPIQHSCLGADDGRGRARGKDRKGRGPQPTSTFWGGQREPIISESFPNVSWWFKTAAVPTKKKRSDTSTWGRTGTRRCGALLRPPNLPLPFQPTTSLTSIPSHPIPSHPPHQTTPPKPGPTVRHGDGMGPGLRWEEGRCVARWGGTAGAVCVLRDQFDAVRNAVLHGRRGGV